jgi:hypothetical protein
LDRNVNVRFFHVEQAAGAATFSAALRQISQLALLDREAEVEDEIVVRLERADFQGNFARGELIRRQTSNLPPKALSGQPIERLGIQSIGHSSAFLYDSELSVLGLEQARNGITSTRLGLYVARFMNGPKYDILPVPTQEMWDTLRSGRLRAMYVRSAAPQSLQAADADTEGVRTGLVALKNATGTYFVEVKLGMIRGEPDINPDRSLGWFNWFRRERENDRGGITKVYVDIIPEGETQAEHINLLAGQIGSRQRLTLPEDNPSASYQIREAFLTDVLNRHRDELRRRYHQ